MSQHPQWLDDLVPKGIKDDHASIISYFKLVYDEITNANAVDREEVTKESAKHEGR